MIIWLIVVVKIRIHICVICSIHQISKYRYNSYFTAIFICNTTPLGVGLMKETIWRMYWNRSKISNILKYNISTKSILNSIIYKHSIFICMYLKTILEWVFWSLHDYPFFDLLSWNFRRGNFSISYIDF